MNRVVRWVDELIGDGTIDDAVIQSASFDQRPMKASTIGVIPADELARLIETAARVVTHGGPGLILQARAAGRQPIVIARDPRFGEHVDAHQLRFVEWLSAREPIVPVNTIASLREALHTREIREQAGAEQSNAVRRIRQIVLGDPP
jgi:UDP-N-acetylglucosamine transferase subunit ALG13